MQKVLRILEAYVEWIALGLALLFLGWTTYTYLVKDPVSKELEGTQVGVGTVDKFIDEHAAQRLREKMDPNAQPPNFTVPDFRDVFQKEFALDGVEAPQLADNYFDYAPFDVGNIASQKNTIGPPVLQLPTLPVAQPLLTAAALDTLAPAAQAGAAPAPAQPASTGPASGKDVRLVVAAFTIPWNDLYKEWNDSFGPDKEKPGSPARLDPAPFQILAITAYRSELINGVWSKDEKIDILNGQDLPKYPDTASKNPGIKDIESQYVSALMKSPKSVVAPEFPAVNAGVVWKDPLVLLSEATSTPANPSANPSAANPNGAINLPEPYRANTMNMSDSLDGTLLAQAYGGRGGGPPGGGFRGGPPPPRFAPPVAPQPQQAAPVEPTIIPPAPGTVDAVVTLANPGNAPNPVPVEPEQAKNNITAMPAKSPDFCIYIIDATADAGKTYRYCISYKALNPLFNKAPQHVSTKHAGWVDQFDLESKVSGYSPEVKVPTQTYFFCGQSSQGAKQTFPFDVFTWTGGKWLKSTFVASIGDPVGAIDHGIDYATGWTYAADLRAGRQGKKFIALVDNEGNVQLRDAAQDSSSPDYKKTVQWVEQTKNGPPQPGGMPGNPYGGSPYGGGPPPGMPGGYGPPGIPPGYGPPGVEPPR